jgi:hypothetical protein
MGWRYHKSVRLFPGVRLNMSKSGPSVSVGVPGFHENFSARGRRTTVSLSGTGLSYTTTHHHHKTYPRRYMPSDHEAVHFGHPRKTRPFQRLNV